MSPVFYDYKDKNGIPRPTVLLRRLGLTIVALLVLAVAALVFLEIENQLDRSRAADSDNTTWNLAQFEVDLLNLDRSVQSALLSAPEIPESKIEDVRLSFDIFYSRVKILDRSAEIARLSLTKSQAWLDLAVEGGILEQTAAVIDGADSALAAALPEISTTVQTIQPGLRRAIVDSLVVQTNLADTWRNDLRKALQFFAATALGLLGIMSVMMVTIFSQSRAQVRHSRLLEGAVQNLRSTINASINPVLVINKNDAIVGWNSAGEELLSLTEADQGTKRFSQVVAFDDKGLNVANISRMIEDGSFHTTIGDRRMRMSGTRPDGSIFPVEVTLAQVVGEDDEAQIIAFLRDMTDQIERETALTEARNSALRGDEAKARFLAVMSHEMRTPLNGLLSATELLMRTTRMDDRQTWLSGIIHSCGRATLDQVNNVLELTRLGSSDNPGYANTTFSVVDTIRDLIQHSHADAMVRGNSLVLADPLPFIPPVSSARPLFQRIVNNLLSNAIKFTENGTITVAIDVEPGIEIDSYSMRVSVSDTGIGIAEKDLERIFHNFETLDSSYARVREGSGLGLGIAKLSAEALGGRITVESRLGEGSTFSLFVTMRRAESSGQSNAVVPAAVPSSQPLNVLVVEDNALNRHLLMELLRHQGHRVTPAVDGIEAVEIAAENEFDVILMDVSMPRMDGLEATRRIRSGGGKCKTVPVIAVTANADPDKLQDFIDSGMNDVMTKPIDISKLDSLIRRYVPQSISALVGKSKTGAVVEKPVEKTVKKAADPTKVVPSGASDLPRRPAVEDAVALLDEATLSDLEEQLGRDFITNMTRRFVVEADLAMTELVDTEAQGDLPKAAQVAHKTAGAAAALGLKGLHKVLVTFENEAKAGEADAARDRLARIEAIKRDTYEILKERGLIA